MNILDEIVAYKKEQLEKQKQVVPFINLVKALDKALISARFQDRISQKGTHLIAEIKKASPAAGMLRQDFDLLSIAKSYAEGGAACLSVLTEDKYFKGDLSYLGKVSEVVSLPLLRKDFIVDEYQIYESKVHAADAILLMVAILEPRRVQRFLQIARTVHLDVLVEVHDEKELSIALDSGAMMIGINTRNLKDFSIHVAVVSDLVKKIPKDALIVAESGIKTREDIVFMKDLHVNAILVGETLMRAPDMKAKTKEFVGFLQ